MSDLSDIRNVKHDSDLTSSEGGFLDCLSPSRRSDRLSNAIISFLQRSVTAGSGERVKRQSR